MGLSLTLNQRRQGKTCQSYEKLINFQYRSRQREISIFGRLISGITVDRPFIEHSYLLGEGSFF